MNDDREVPSGADVGWTKVEFRNLELGDSRVERRLTKVAEALSQQPERPINLASRDAAATKAAYRLFNNEKASGEKILSAHRNRTLERMQGEPIVLAIQDTTILDFSGHKKTEGLGPIHHSSTEHPTDLQGLLLHTTFAVTPKGLPLGILVQKCWARDGYCDSDITYRKRAFHEKESRKWTDALNGTANLSTTATTVIHVADRECDIYEFLREAQTLDTKYVIRACYDRRIESEEFQTIQQQLRALTSQGEVEIDVPTQKRKAILELIFAPMVLRAPSRLIRAKRQPISCWVVHVREIQAPTGTEPLSWTLLTNIPVTSHQQAAERLSWYRRRWSIEEFHKILKDGCAVEDCRLQTADRLKRFIALFSVIAWRIFWMVHIHRSDPTAPAEVVLTHAEINTLRSLKRFKGTLSSTTSLTVKQAIVAVACLGGYLNRRNDLPPGAIVIWRGWQQLSTMAELYESMRPECG